MKINNFRLIIFLVLLCSFITLTSCSNPLGEREYLADLYIDLPGTEHQLLIKEWRYLLGSGEEVYFVSSSAKKPQLLGKLTGGDDGYCPFNDGKYEISCSEGVLSLSWSFDGSDNYTRSESFVLPEQ